MIILKDCADEHDCKWLVYPVYSNDKYKLLVEGNSLYVEPTRDAAEERAKQLNEYARDVLGRSCPRCEIYVWVSTDGRARPRAGD